MKASVTDDIAARFGTTLFEVSFRTINDGIYAFNLHTQSAKDLRSSSAG